MGAEIVSLSSRRMARLDPDLAQVEAYWDALRAGRIAPSRSEVDPRGLAGVLSRCFILEKIAPGLGRVRVSGRELAAILGAEPRGMPFSVFFRSDSRETLEDTLNQVFSSPAIARLAIRAAGRLGVAGPAGQMMLLPLRSDLGEISRVLGVVSIAVRPDRRQHPLEIDTVSLSDIPRGEPLAASPVAGASRPGEGPGGEVVRFDPGAD